MYVVALDQAWLQTPFFSHRRLIKNSEEVEVLKKLGIREVVIDTARGADVEEPLLPAPVTEVALPNQSNRTPSEASAYETYFQPLVKELEVARTIHTAALAAAQSIFDGVAAGSPLSQMVAITDLYDAMLTDYSKGTIQPIEVLRELYLQGNAGAFHCELLERVIRCLAVYPAGSVVKLKTGERGIVVAANRNDSLKPTLRIISSRNGFALSKGPIVSLADSESSSPERRIVRPLDPGKKRVDVLAYLKLAPAFSG